MKRSEAVRRASSRERRLRGDARGAGGVEARTDAAAWVEIALDNALWKVPAARMKRKLREKLQGASHLGPLPKQAVAILFSR